MPGPNTWAVVGTWATHGGIAIAALFVPDCTVGFLDFTQAAEPWSAGTVCRTQ